MTMKTYTYKDLPRKKSTALTRRPKMDFASVFGTVQPILDDVESRGDAAIKEYTKKFDGVDLESVAMNPDLSRFRLTRRTGCDRYGHAEYLPVPPRAVFDGA